MPGILIKYLRLLLKYIQLLIRGQYKAVDAKSTSLKLPLAKFVKNDKIKSWGLLWVSYFFKKMLIDLDTPKNYDYGRTADLFESRGWKVECVRVSNVDLIIPHRRAAIECVDGRHANRRDVEIVEIEGPKLPGGLNGVCALKTGGCSVGFNHAAQEVSNLGFGVGTHNDCGFFRLWRENKLEFAKYPLILPAHCAVEGAAYSLGHWIKLKARHWKGKHFHVPGEHEEEGLVFNPFIGVTPISRSDRFSYDHWLMKLLGINGNDSTLLLAETIEQLSPHRRVEILVK